MKKITQHTNFLLPNTPDHAGSLLHNLEQAAEDIGHCVNADKAKYMCFNRGAISTLKSGHLKLVDNLTNQGSSVSPTESDVNIRLAEA